MTQKPKKRHNDEHKIETAAQVRSSAPQPTFSATSAPKVLARGRETKKTAELQVPDSMIAFWKYFRDSVET